MGPYEIVTLGFLELACTERLGNQYGYSRGRRLRAPRQVLRSGREFLYTAITVVGICVFSGTTHAEAIRATYPTHLGLELGAYLDGNFTPIPGQPPRPAARSVAMDETSSRFRMMQTKSEASLNAGFLNLAQVGMNASSNELFGIAEVYGTKRVDRVTESPNTTLGAVYQVRAIHYGWSYSVHVSKQQMRSSLSAGAEYKGFHSSFGSMEAFASIRRTQRTVGLAARPDSEITTLPSGPSEIASSFTVKEAQPIFVELERIATRKALATVGEIVPGEYVIERASVELTSLKQGGLSWDGGSDPAPEPMFHIFVHSNTEKVNATQHHWYTCIAPKKNSSQTYLCDVENKRKATNTFALDDTTRIYFNVKEWDGDNKPDDVGKADVVPMELKTARTQLPIRMKVPRNGLLRDAVVYLKLVNPLEANELELVNQLKSDTARLCGMPPESINLESWASEFMTYWKAREAELEAAVQRNLAAKQMLERSRARLVKCLEAKAELAPAR